MGATGGSQDYARRSAAAYERQLREHPERYGIPGNDPEEAGRRAAAVTSAGQAWAEDAGPFYDTEGARVALGGVTKQAVSQRVREGRLLGLRLAADGGAPGRDRLVYPAWQFRAAVLRHLPPVLAAAGFDPQRPVTGWTVAAWLTSPDPDLDGLTPEKVLQADRPEPVIAAAREVRASLGADERDAVRAAAS